MAKIQIVGLVDGGTSPFDEQWLVEYDPARPGIDPFGLPLIAHLVTTPDRSKAKEFPSVREAEECWELTHGTRKDGRPNRPLRAFMIRIQPNRTDHATPERVTFASEFVFA